METEVTRMSQAVNKSTKVSGSESDGRDRAQTNDLLQVAEVSDLKKNLADKKIESVIQEKIMKDKSPEAKRGRRQMLVRAAYGEFMCSLLFYGPIFCCIANSKASGWPAGYTTLASAFVAGFQAIGISFAFSSISGAQFNSAISFALWLTGKLSNRRCVLYVFVQLCASVVGMIIVACIFSGNLQDTYDSIAVVPPNDIDLGRVFATEFFLTFFLTYIAFTVAFEDAERSKKDTMSFKTISDSKGLTLYASTPQSKTGFAPFSIGLTIFSLNLIGGSSGGAFNPGRLLGPALFSGKWDYIYLYWIGELLGAAVAGLLVTNMHRFGIESKRDEVSATEAVKVSIPVLLPSAPVISHTANNTSSDTVGEGNGSSRLGSLHGSLHRADTENGATNPMVLSSVQV